MTAASARGSSPARQTAGTTGTPSALEAGGQLGAQSGHYGLSHFSAPLQLAGEKPHLPLPAAPLAAGGDMDHRCRHEGGSASMAMLPGSRRLASGPASRAISSSRRRSSARLNGLCR